MKLDPEVFREAVKYLREKDNSYVGCCYAIGNSLYKTNTTRDYDSDNHKYFRHIYECRNNDSVYYWGLPNKRNLLKRQIALDFAALMLEDDNNAN